MKKNISAPLLIVSVIFLILNACHSEVYYGEHKLPDHPRLLMLKGEKLILDKFVQSDILWQKVHKTILDESDSLIDKPVLERIQKGKRLLSVSQEILRRVYYLSYSYRFTNDPKYLKRAEQEMLAAASFSDWNPSHFLDVAEMTAGMAIGYDWLNDDLKKASRETIRDAIITKGLEPSIDTGSTVWWPEAKHNWNQVCNAGLTLGALAVYEDNPELAKQIIDRAIETIALPMKEYSPDGAYPEGYSYWGYGTTFNVLFLSAIEKAINTDFGLNEIPGFLQTASYLKNMTGPTGKPFNYSDCGSRASLNIAMFWFANRLKDYSLLQNEIDFLKKDYNMGSGRLLPSLIIWASGMNLQNIQNKEDLIWVGQGLTPVALMRTSWDDPHAVFVGMKGGTPSSNHSHMDIGSFVMDANGERWAMDFGSQDYYSLESKKVDLWSMSQESQRWEVFRYNNFAHNTLTINGELQKVKGYAKINTFSSDTGFIFAKTDLSEVYENAVHSVERGISIIDKKYVAVRDEILTDSKPAKIRWNMLTPAKVKITGKNNAELTQNGKTLNLSVLEPIGAELKTWSTEPIHDYDAPNPGTVFIGFEIDLPVNRKTSLVVLLVPEGYKIPSGQKIPGLDSWK